MSMHQVDKALTQGCPYRMTGPDWLRVLALFVL